MFIEFLDLVLLVVFLFALLAFGTQVLIPLCVGTPLFPFFRHKRRELEHDLAEAKQDVEDFDLQRQIQQIKKRTKNPNA